MKTFSILLLLLASLTHACGKPVDKNGDVFLPVSAPPAGAGRGSSNNEPARREVGNTVPIPSPSQTPSVKSPASEVVPMTLEQAKAKCVMCHQSGGPGASVWSSANGGEGEWKAFAALAKASVAAGRMPLGSGMNASEKDSFIAFLDILLGVTPSNPSGPDSPTPKFSFESARALCVGCHNSSGQEPVLENISQWREEKKEIRKEIVRGRMPYGKTLSQQERDALIAFVDSI